MYERKIPLDLDCGVRITMSILGSKWKPCILDELRENSKRPSELHKVFHKATPRVLNQQLKELEEFGMVRKTIYAELPPRSEYFITDLGKSLLPIVDMMNVWGNDHREQLENKLTNETL